MSSQHEAVASNTIYEMRFQGLAFALPLLRIIGFYAFVTASSITLILVSATHPAPGIPPASEFSSAMSVILLVLTVVCAYMAFRAYWQWRHTTLRMDERLTGRHREGSIVWLTGEQHDTVPTRKIDNLNIKQSVLARILFRFFNWSIWSVTIDTPATSDESLKTLRYVRFAPELKDLYAELSFRK